MADLHVSRRCPARSGVIAGLIALLATLALLPSGQAGAVIDGTNGKTAGLGISRPGVPQQVIANDLPRMKSDGINTGTIDVWWDVDKQDSSSVHPGSITPSDADLVLAIQRVKTAGMKVMFEPKVWCPSCQPMHWRGILKPKNRSAFFDSYRKMINHYADLSQQTGVDVYFIGSEMNSLQDATDEWRRIAREARVRYKGRLAYEVNWDVWNEVKFWDAVDVVSVSAYFPLSDLERPTVAELKAGWQASRVKEFKGHTWAKNMATLARTTGKQVLFGEAGYLSSTYAARKPYDESQRFDPDQQVQADAYQALLETFEHESWWMGVVWWEWVPEAGSDSGSSMTYSPRDKQAEKLMSAWYARGWRPGAPGGPIPIVPPLAAARGRNAAAAQAQRRPDAVAAAATRPLDLSAIAAAGTKPMMAAGPVADAETSSSSDVGAKALRVAALLLAGVAFVFHRRLVLLRRQLRNPARLA
jgi:hypothetical protein